MSNTLPFARMAMMNEKPRALSPIGLFYLIEVEGITEGSYITESVCLPRGKDLTQQDGLAALKEHSDAMTIFECLPGESLFRDVSEDIALLWLAECECERDELPDFITNHVSEDDIDEHFAEIDEARAMRREIASPELSGRF